MGKHLTLKSSTALNMFIDAQVAIYLAEAVSSRAETIS